MENLTLAFVRARVYIDRLRKIAWIVALIYVVTGKGYQETLTDILNTTFEILRRIVPHMLVVLMVIGTVACGHESSAPRSAKVALTVFKPLSEDKLSIAADQTSEVREWADAWNGSVTANLEVLGPRSAGFIKELKVGDRTWDIDVPMVGDTMVFRSEWTAHNGGWLRPWTAVDPISLLVQLTGDKMAGAWPRHVSVTFEAAPDPE